VLPGSLQAYEESPIYARTNGYLVRWYKDIGSRVKTGELLAKIDTPEVDQELDQTKAARQQTVAQLELAKISADRWENLRKTDSVSAQEAISRPADISRPGQPGRRCNVRRLEQLEASKRCTPLHRVLTRATSIRRAHQRRRWSAGRELFDLARVDPLRVFTSVPQAYAPYIKVAPRLPSLCRSFPARNLSPQSPGRPNRSTPLRALC